MLQQKNFLLLRQQLFYFGLTGACAALVHMLLVWLLVTQIFYLLPLQANIFAFLISFWISYLGHSHLTFNTKKHKVSYAVPRFFMVATMSFVLNETLYFFLLHFTPLPYLWALFLVLGIVPVFTFTLSKCWVFKIL